MRGREVARLVDGPVAGGRHVFSWDGSDDGGRELSPGVYYMRLEADGWKATRSVVLAR